MSRTAAGYAFNCKVCGCAHVLVEGEPHDGIRVPCAWEEDKIESYDKKDFRYFHGMVNLLLGLVKEAE